MTIISTLHSPLLLSRCHTVSIKTEKSDGTDESDVNSVALFLETAEQMIFRIDNPLESAIG